MFLLYEESTVQSMGTTKVFTFFVPVDSGEATEARGFRFSQSQCMCRSTTVTFVLIPVYVPKHDDNCRTDKYSKEHKTILYK